MEQKNDGRNQTLAIRSTAAQRLMIQACARAAGYRATSEFIRHLALGIDCPRTDPEELGRERCVQLLALLVPLTAQAMELVPDPETETGIALQALARIYATMLVVGAPPMTPSPILENAAAGSPPGDPNKPVFLQIRFNEQERSELLRRARGGISHYIRRLLLREVSRTSLELTGTERWARLLGSHLESLQAAMEKGGGYLEVTVMLNIQTMESMLTGGFSPQP